MGEREMGEREMGERVKGERVKGEREMGEDWDSGVERRGPGLVEAGC